MQLLKKIGILLLVLAYAGQGVAASALPCGGISDSNDVAATTAMADIQGIAHSGHHNMAGGKKPGISALPATSGGGGCGHCCDAVKCAGQHHCQGAAVLPQGFLVGGNPFGSPYLAPGKFSVPGKLVARLFRPPISR